MNSFSSGGEDGSDARTEARRFRTSDFRGQKLVLVLCHGESVSCWTRELDDFTRLAAEFERCGTWIVVMADDPETARRTMAGRGSSHLEIVGYPNDEARRSLGLDSSEVDGATLLFDRDGTVHRMWKRPKVSGHAEEVLRSARALY